MKRDTIIILEDEEIIGRMYKKALEAVGHNVFWVKTIDDMEALVNNVVANFVLVDHGIKGYEKAGIDVIPVIRRKLPEAYIIMLSNYSHQELQKQALKAGARDFLIKLNTPPKALVKYIENIDRKS